MKMVIVEHPLLLAKPHRVPVRPVRRAQRSLSRRVIDGKGDAHYCFNPTLGKTSRFPKVGDPQ
jgi:hypothetical protein